MAKEITNPHDQFFRATFSRLDVARDFLTNYLPLEIAGKFELTSLEIAQESFSDDELKSHHTDFLFRVKLKTGENAFVFILLEHKSYADEFAAFQLLRYMTRIWEKALREKSKKLPPILPIVFYHGKKKWKVSRKFSDLINAADEFSEYVPRFSYYLCDLSEFDGEKLKGGALIMAAMLAMKNIFGKSLSEQFVEMARLVRLKYEKETLEFIALIVRYFMAVQKHLTADEVRKALKTAFLENEEEIMSIAVKEFIEQGIEQGVKVGKKTGLVDFNLKLLRKRFGKTEAETKNRLENMTIEQLQEFGLAIFDFADVSDIRDWLKKNK